jgi:ATP-binding cassette subfamily F protein uup
VIDDLSMIVMRGDRLGLIGPNGAGKSTLLKLILGAIEPDSGTVKLGTQLQVAYFDQMREQLDPEKSVVETISPGSEWIEIGGERKHVMSYLGDFLFAPARAKSPVSSLSGGERARLLLARLFARPANILVLDEPTNDLDIETLELLEELLQEYPGTVLLVSHDRSFLDNVVTQTIVNEGDGIWQDYVGGFADWERQRHAPATISRTSQLKNISTASKPVQAAVSQVTPQGIASQSAVGSPSGKGKSNKLAPWEAKELAQLPADIAALEKEQEALLASLSDGSLYKDQTAKRTEIEIRLVEIEKLMT